MKFFFKLSIFFIAVFFTAPLFAQENKPVTLKTIPVKTKNSDGKDTTVVKDTTIVNAKGVRQIDVSELLEQVFHIKREKKPTPLAPKRRSRSPPALGIRWSRN